MTDERSRGLALCAALVLVTSGCKLLERRQKGGNPGPRPFGPGVATATPDSPTLNTAADLADLGLARYPAGADTRAAMLHDWSTTALTPRAYRVRYALDRAEAQKLLEAYHGYAQRVHYKPDGPDRFAWQPPPGCTGDMRCVYDELVARDRPSIAALGERFRARVAAAKLDALEAANLVVAMVQAITYEVPSNEPFGVLPPPLVASQKRGDCDSKALLAHMLLASNGIDSVLISSKAHKHTMLGIALPTGGSSFEWKGRRYAFAEMTAVGSPIGHINPELTSPSDWRVVPLAHQR